MILFTHDAVTVAISAPPVRPFTLPCPLPQQDGLDSTGNRYVYDRSAVITRNLTIELPRVTSAELTAVLTFFHGTILGNRYQFWWTDHDGAVRLVRYLSHVWQQRTTVWYRLTVSLCETLTPDGLLDSSGAYLLDSTGAVLQGVEGL